MRTRTLVVSVLLLTAVVVVRAEVAEPRRVSGESMSPTLHQGDVVLVEKVGATRAHRGDLVTFDSPADGQQTVKRVVGVAGDVVAIRDAYLYVNDRPVDEPEVDHAAIDGLYYGPVEVPAGQVLVLGDNRARSIDSREHGPVDVASLTGTVVLSIWPPGGR